MVEKVAVTAKPRESSVQTSQLTYLDGFRFGIGFMVASILGGALLSLLAFVLMVIVHALKF